MFGYYKIVVKKVELMRDDAVIQRRCFREVNLEDPFFDSLKEGYEEFSKWFSRKSEEQALVVYDENGSLQGFMYLKEEVGPIKDISPPLNASRVLKVGTFKVEAHGTRLGERFVKKIFDYALSRDLKHIYVTVFPEHKKLIERLQTYGFLHHGIKKGANGQEDVYVKDFARLQNDTKLDYPVVNALECDKWLLGIKPEYHTRLFPDSILRTEDNRMVEDLSYTNSIHKIYVGWALGLQKIKPRDIVVMYRMKEEDKPAEFSAVATSLCVVEENRPKRSFRNDQEFVLFCQRHSIFDKSELQKWFRNPAVHAVKMTYNVALPKRPNRRSLADEVGLDREERWSVLQLTDAQFEQIVKRGKVNEGIVIN